METGKIKFFNIGKGFGMLINDSDQSEAFVHFSQVMDDAKILLEKEDVTYELTKTDKGLSATNLQRNIVRLVGKIESFQSGFGFIKALNSEEKYFVHHSDFEGDGFKNIEDDFEVEFTPD